MFRTLNGTPSSLLPYSAWSVCLTSPKTDSRDQSIEQSRGFGYTGFFFLGGWEADESWHYSVSKTIY